MTLEGAFLTQDSVMVSHVLGCDKGKASVLPPSGQRVTRGAGQKLVSAEDLSYKQSKGGGVGVLPKKRRLGKYGTERLFALGFLSFVLTSRERGSPTVPR